MLINITYLIILFIASIFDIKNRIIPNTLNILILILAIFNFRVENLLGLILAFLLLIISVNTNAFGGGDIKLIGAVGLLFGFSKVFEIFIFSALIFAVFGLIYLLIKGKGKSLAFPFVPFIFLGSLIEIIL